MFIDVNGRTINLYNIKKFWDTYQDDGKWIVVFEFMNGEREVAKFINREVAKEKVNNLKAFLDRKHFNFDKSE